MTTFDEAIPIAVARDVGELAREARIQAGLSQAALAEAAGVGRQWLNEFERGKKPSAPIDMILRVLAQTTATLLFASNDDSLSTPYNHDEEWDRDREIDIDVIVDQPSKAE